MRLKVILAVLVGLLLVVASGCGGSKKSASTTGAATETTATETTTTEATTTEGTTSGGEFNLSNEDCANLAAAGQTFSQAMQGSVPTDIASQLARLQALAKAAPPEIKSDFETLAQAAIAFEKLGLKPGEQPTPAQLQQLLSTLNTAELLTAISNINKWVQKNCTVGSGGSVGSAG
jgi:hypothetical protein